MPPSSLEALWVARSSLQLGEALRKEAEVDRTKSPPWSTHRALLLTVGVSAESITRVD